MPRGDSHTGEASLRCPKKAQKAHPDRLRALGERAGCGALLLLTDDAPMEAGPATVTSLIKAWLEAVTPGCSIPIFMGNSLRPKPTTITVGNWGDKAFKRVADSLARRMRTHSMQLPVWHGARAGQAVGVPPGEQDATPPGSSGHHPGTSRPKLMNTCGFVYAPTDRSRRQTSVARLMLTAPFGEHPKGRRSQLTRLVDEAVQAGHVLQAFLTEEHLFAPLSTLVYEKICGADDRGLVPPPQAQSRLIAIYETMWVGEELAISVSKALAGEPDLLPLGKGLKLTFADIDRAEALLDSLLLGPDDYREIRLRQ